MAEIFLNDPQRLPICKKQCGTGMTQIVKTDFFELWMILDKSPETIADFFGREKASVFAHKYVFIIFVVIAVPTKGLIISNPFLPKQQLILYFRQKRERSPAGFRFQSVAFFQNNFPVLGYLYYLMADMQFIPFKVNILPA